MAEPGKPDRNDKGAPTDPLASAAAVGFALAAQAAEFWLGVASGLAKAGQDMLERNRKSEGSPAFSADPASPVEAAKAAARTVMADVERAAKDVAEVTTKFAATPAESTAKAAKPAAKPAEKKPAPKAVEKKAEPKAVTPAAPKPKTAKVKAEAASKTVPPAPVIMPEDFRAPKALARPAKPDDLKLLDGVGPRLEQTLNSLGVWTYAQVAAWTPEEIAYVEDMTGLNGAAATNNWLSRAASLAKDETKH